jgi:hypothetical protein
LLVVPFITAAVKRFLSKRGGTAGAESSMYRLAYRYFEKLRIQRNQPKTARRIRNEAELLDGFSLNPARYHMVQRWELEKENEAGGNSE